MGHRPSCVPVVLRYYDITIITYPTSPLVGWLVHGPQRASPMVPHGPPWSPVVPSGPQRSPADPVTLLVPFSERGP
eukprot:2538657-Prymnesium_polylepis.1